MTAKPNCRPKPQKRMRNLMSRLWRESNHATARMAATPSIPVNRPISPESWWGRLVTCGGLATRLVRQRTLADHLENQLPFLRPRARNPERILHQFSRLVQVLFAGVI